MIAEVPLGAVPTVYARIGDVFAWLCVAGCAVAVIVALATGRSASLHPFD